MNRRDEEALAVLELVMRLRLGNAALVDED